MTVDRPAYDGPATWSCPLLLAALLTPIPGEAVQTRDQTPRPPFPYEVEEVEVVTSETLACTLTTPIGGDDLPGVVLQTVAGANDRDQTHAGHKPYLVLADHLTRAGIATLRCDDRGVGGSSGDVTASKIQDLAGDAMAMVDRLSGVPRVSAVGVIGNSEGSVTGAIAAASGGNARFLVMLGGVGVKGSQLIRYRQEAAGRANGLDESAIASALEPFDQIVAWVEEVGGVGLEVARQTHPDLVRDALALLTSGRVPRDPMLPSDPEAQLALFLGPWYHAQVTLDAPAILREVRVPTLALTGSLDKVNLPDQNLPAIGAALEAAGNPDVTTMEVPGLNHVFQTASTGSMLEYATLAESFSPMALDLITDWILERFGQGSGGGDTGHHDQ
jgi:pimeloyl-ACP methyl ester carboxylesterase